VASAGEIREADYATRSQLSTSTRSGGRIQPRRLRSEASGGVFRKAVLTPSFDHRLTRELIRSSSSIHAARFKTLHPFDCAVECQTSACGFNRVNKQHNQGRPRRRPIPYLQRPGQRRDQSHSRNRPERSCFAFARFPERRVYTSCRSVSGAGYPRIRKIATT
jgi:hypothetical protein